MFHSLQNQPLDVVLKLFVLSLEDDAIDWFTSLTNKSINTSKECQRVFLMQWEERKDDIFLLVVLNGVKRNENEIIIELNARFDKIV